ncbi:MAG: ketoacyl-ACP synthase III [Propionibacteriaceae bacterium]|jgi:3-oxoacyl-[acyl-carrier-protein] synthase-3|nr:ketoacyl-ACP synthase III [Propionibacteriaceae bacterium]
MIALPQSSPRPGSAILGLGAYEPSRVISNDQMCQWIDSSDEWIRQRTGIVERRWAEPHETILAMAASAAQRALDHAGLTGDQLDGVIVATVTHLEQTPALAVRLAGALGCGPCPAWDISAACAGFCYGLAQADALVRSGVLGHVLVVAGDRLSDMTDLTDRSTAFLFADGAGAAVVGPSPSPRIGPVVWGSDPAQGPTIGQTLDWAEAVSQGRPAHLRMDGQPVFRWATTAMADATRRIMADSGLTPDQLDLFVPHQANNRITDSMLRHLRLPESVQVARSIQRLGNTSASSIPLAIDQLYRAGQVKEGATCLMVGFGAGLVYAGQVALLPAPATPARDQNQSPAAPERPAAPATEPPTLPHQQ